MGGLTLPLLAALVLAAPASAATGPPSGFYEARVLEPAASFVAGKPAHVYCAVTDDDWREYAKANTTPDVGGLTLVGSDQSELAPMICHSLRARLNRRPARADDFAASLLILVHESIHQRGVADEGQTECTAIHEMPRVAVKFFHVKVGKQLWTLMTDAWWFHRAAAPQFQIIC